MSRRTAFTGLASQLERWSIEENEKEAEEAETVTLEIFLRTLRRHNNKEAVEEKAASLAEMLSAINQSINYPNAALHDVRQSSPLFFSSPQRRQWPLRSGFYI